MSTLSSPVYSSWDQQRQVLGTPELSLYLDDTMDLWQVFTDAEGKRARLSSDTYDSLCTHRPAINAFRHNVLAGTTGLYTLDTAIPVYAEAAAKAAAQYGFGVVEDRLALLVERLGTLVAQASGINAGKVDVATLQAFTLAWGQGQARLVALETEMARARALLDLAATAIVDL